jgi:hypothetical protein
VGNPRLIENTRETCKRKYYSRIRGYPRVCRGPPRLTNRSQALSKSRECQSCSPFSKRAGHDCFGGSSWKPCFARRRSRNPSLEIWPPKRSGGRLYFEKRRHLAAVLRRFYSITKMARRPHLAKGRSNGLRICYKAPSSPPKRA